MKSFPSALSVNPLVQRGTLSTNLKQTLYNLGEIAVHNALSDGSDSGLSKEQLGQYLDLNNFNYDDYLSWHATANAKEAELMFLPSINVTNTKRRGDFADYNTFYENVFKIPTDILQAVNSYRRLKKTSAIERRHVNVDNSRKQGEETSTTQAAEEIAIEAVTTSLFNPLYGVRAQGFMRSIPKMYADTKNDTKYEVTGAFFNDNSERKVIGANKEGNVVLEKDSNVNEESTKLAFQLSSNKQPDFTDCSIKKLVELSFGRGSNLESIYKRNEMSSLGRATYRYIDFMYCRDVGKISNNHLITLRRFTHPVGDNIYTPVHTPHHEIIDRGHLVTWFGNDENKLEDICKYTMNSTWKDLKAKIQDINSKEDDNHIGASLVNLANPGYISAVLRGDAGGPNAILNWMASKTSIFEAKGSYEGDSARYHRDENRVWEPKNTIQETHTYEGKIQFAHDFNLTFTYEMRHYDGINGKTAFLDLMGNILRVCHNTGTFWGGGIRFLGAPRNNAGWKKMNSMLDSFQNGVMGAIDGLFNCSSLSDLGSWFTDLIGGAYEAAKQMISGAMNEVPGNTGKEKAKNAVKGIANIGMGMLKNKLGRPAIYAMNSILNGSYVGMWHVTIGNPRNPILSIGNLILMNTEVSHFGPLGIDDFPTKIKVVCSLKHGRPRDSMEIASMYTMGQGGLLLPLNKKQFREYFNIWDYTEMADLGWSTEAFAYKNVYLNSGVKSSAVSMDNVNTTWSNLST